MSDGPIPAAILYEDRFLLAVNKPAGALVVRGRAGEQEPSLIERLAAFRGERLLPVHRLDRGTSGVLLIARTAEAHKVLGAAFEGREVEKRYLALVRGEPPEDRFEVDCPLVPARRGKSRPAAPGEQGRPARTRFVVLERLGGFAWIEARPETGRMHQIRVHLKFVGHPLAVDPLYGRGEPLRAGELGAAPSDAAVLERTPLHAAGVRLRHPQTREPLVLEAPLPADLESVRRLLADRRAVAGGRPGSDSPADN